MGKETCSSADQPFPKGKVEYSEVEAPTTSMKEVARVAEMADHENVSDAEYYKGGD